MTSPPKRAVILTAKIEADSRDEMVDALEDMARRLAMGEITNGCSGGPTRSSIYEYIEGEVPTHDEYFRQLHAYLAERRSASPPEGVGE
jgi:hypothetical protein